MAKKKPVSRRVAPALTDVARVIFYVKDTERSARWYSEVLGIPVRHKESGWVELETQGVSLCLHAGREAGAPRDPSQVGFRVANFEVAWRALQLREVPGLTEPFSPCPGVRCLSFRDPDGNALGIEGS
jgi:catechol 2,3-dioxygenase-like lactoylglutathione lyase family enzyme